MKAPSFYVTTTGLLWLWLGAIIIALAYVSPFAYLLAAVYYCGLGIRFRQSIRALPAVAPLEISREIAARLSQGHAENVTYTIRYHGAIPARLEFVESSPALGITTDDARQIALHANAVVTIQRTILPARRGIIHFGGFNLRLQHVSGLLERRYAIPSALTVQVFPGFTGSHRTSSLASRELRLRDGARSIRRYSERGERVGVRDYVAGDAFRSIDFKASAKRGQLMVVERELERAQQVMLLIDCGRYMIAGAPEISLLDYVSSAALNIAELTQTYGDSVGIGGFAAAPLAWLTPRAGIAQLRSIAKYLSTIQVQDEEPDLEAALMQLRKKSTKRSILIIFSQLFDPSAVNRLRGALSKIARRHTVLCVFLDDGVLNTYRAQTVTDDHTAMQVQIAHRLHLERERAMHNLRGLGVSILATPAANLNEDLVAHYLRLRRDTQS